MTIHCPKCGFSQPRDQYCARCGIDMLAFKAPPKSFMKSLSENLFLQLILVFIIGFGAVFYLRQHTKSKTIARVQYLRGVQVESSDGRHQFASQGDERMIDAGQTAEVTQRDLGPAGQAAVDAKGNRKAETKIYFLQMSTATLAQWIENETLTRVETADGVMIGYLQDFSKILASGLGNTRVLKSDSYPLVAEQVFTSKMDFPRREETTGRQLAQAAPSVTAYATLDTLSEESVTGQLEVSTDPQNTYPVQFEMNPSSAILITGFSKIKTPEKSPETELVVVLSLKK